MTRAITVAAALLIWAPGCATFPSWAEQYAKNAAAKVAECSAKGISDREEAEKCLGRFARENGTEAAALVDYWLKSLPED